MATIMVSYAIRMLNKNMKNSMLCAMWSVIRHTIKGCTKELNKGHMWVQKDLEKIGKKHNKINHNGPICHQSASYRLGTSSFSTVVSTVIWLLTMYC